MKSKKLWLGIGAVVLIVLCMGVAFLATQGKTDYYTQIDNRWVTEIDPHGTMNYEYNLDAYDETGKERDITFETSKVLTDHRPRCTAGRRKFERTGKKEYKVCSVFRIGCWKGCTNH